MGFPRHAFQIASVVQLLRLFLLSLLSVGTQRLELKTDCEVEVEIQV